jgi:tetratricopeptide (TPR) repeat protein
LGQLVDKSLVVVEDQQAEVRYRLLETIRQYGVEKLREAGEAAEVRRRHRDWYLTLVEWAEPELRGPRQSEWLERLETEIGNLRLALQSSLETYDVEPGLRLGAGLWRFWEVRSHFAEGRKWLAKLLALSSPSEHAALRARLLNGAGSLAYRQGDTAVASALYEEGLALLRELGDQRGIANLLNNLGNVACDRGEYDTARTLYAESLAIRRTLRDSRGIASSLINMGSLADDQGDTATARTLYRESLEIGRELGDQWIVAASLLNLGELAESSGDLGTAQRLQEESLAIYRELGDKRGIAASLGNMGHLAMQRGDLEVARALLDESLGIQQELGDKRGLAASLHHLGRVARRQGDFPTARARYGASLELYLEQGNHLRISVCLAELAAVANGVGESEQAARLFGAAAAVRELSGAAMEPIDQSDHDRNLAATRDRLGEASFEAAWKEGKAMTVEQAVIAGFQATRPMGAPSPSVHRGGLVADSDKEP